MAQNDEKVLAWFTSNIGKLTYSQLGSRNGSDGTADCSGSMSQALNDAYGGATLYSTISMATRLKELGYERVWTGKTTDARPNKYDVIMTTLASSMAGSGGDSGHIGMMMTNETYISCTAVDWLGKGNFLKNNAIQTCPWLQYKDKTRLQNYCEIWRFSSSRATSKTSPAYNLTIDGAWGKETWKGVQTMLAFIGHNLGASGIDGVGGTITVKALQSALNAKLKLTGSVKLAVDGVFGTLTIKALQKLFGTPQDGKISTPESQLVYKMQEAIKDGKVWL